MNTVYLHRDDLERLIQIIDSTKPVSNMITVTQDNSSGIGFITDAEVMIDMNGMTGAFKVNIVDESSW